MVLRLSSKEQAVVTEIKNLFQAKFPVEKFVVFGSVARGEATKESDLDLLVLTGRPMSHREKHAMYDLVFEVNLARDTNVSILVVDRATWETGFLSALPLYEEVARDGIIL